MITNPNFDRVARPYRWLEYLLLGPALERCRLHFLPQLEGRTRALLFGDGDGRFLAALLARNPALHADAVDTSAAMLNLLRDRCLRTGTNVELRLKTHHTDALSYLGNGHPAPYDLVVTHFFLDCLTQPEVEALAAAIRPKLSADALWLISDFRIPPGTMRLPAMAFVRGLYLAFRVLTGLRTSTLPDHIAALTRAGFTRLAHHHTMLGIVTTELWSRGET